MVITSSIALDLRQAISHMATLLGLRVLGQLCKPMHAQDVKRLASQYLDHDPLHAHPLHVTRVTSELQVLASVLPVLESRLPCVPSAVTLLILMP